MATTRLSPRPSSSPTGDRYPWPAVRRRARFSPFCSPRASASCLFGGNVSPCSKTAFRSGQAGFGTLFSLSESPSDRLPYFFKPFKSLKKWFDSTRKTTLTVFFHTIFPSETSSPIVYRQTQKQRSDPAKPGSERCFLLFSVLSAFHAGAAALSFAACRSPVAKEEFASGSMIYFNTFSH